MTISWILSDDYAGLQAQALGLAEAAGLAAELRVLRPRSPWSRLPARLWPAPLRAIPPETMAPPLPDLLIGCGGMSAVVIAALKKRQIIGRAPLAVQIQNPRIDPARFDLVVVNRHDKLTGPNIIVTRTALHRVTEARLAAEAAVWRSRFAHLPRPLVAVLVGGSNGRFRLDAAAGHRLATQLSGLARDGAGIVITPSRRTPPEITRILTESLVPAGAEIWDGTGDNPYFGMLALADFIIPTIDSVSMMSEAAATRAPILYFELPGKSRRIGLFLDGLARDGRIRPFTGWLDTWPVTPIDDTAQAADEMRRRLHL